MRFLNWLRPRSRATVFQPRCAVCGRPSATIRIVARPDGLHMIYSGPGGSSGEGGVPITPARRDAIAAAFRQPYDHARIQATGFDYDEAGFCAPCGCFYCATHWNVSSTGAGTCPQGHFKSIDPHWSPE